MKELHSRQMDVDAKMGVEPPTAHFPRGWAPTITGGGETTAWVPWKKW